MNSRDQSNTDRYVAPEEPKNAPRDRDWFARRLKNAETQNYLKHLQTYLQDIRDQLDSDEWDAHAALVESNLLEYWAAKRFYVDGSFVEQFRPKVDFDLSDLQKVLVDRLENQNEASYTSQLAGKGRLGAVEKFGEESLELVTASLLKNQTAVVSEAADVLFHMIVLLLSRGVAIEDVYLELKKRTNMSGLEEKASRK